MIGIDADASSMVQASGRAARKLALPNALFVVAGAESMPCELEGIADEVVVQFPWGSLLRAILAGDGSAIAHLTRPGATTRLLVSVTERDGLPRVDVESIACGMAQHGLRLANAHPATDADLALSHSTWAKRLGAGTGRPAWRIDLVASVR